MPWPVPPVSEVRTTPAVDKIVGDGFLAAVSRAGGVRFTCRWCQGLGPRDDGAASVVVERYRDSDVIRLVHPACALGEDIVNVDSAWYLAGLPVCGPDDVTVTLHWEPAGLRLAGLVTVTSISGHVSRLPGKALVQPVNDGQLLRVPCRRSQEGGPGPGYVDLQPGQRATAKLSWNNWQGPQASPAAIVTWNGGAAAVRATGVPQPACGEIMALRPAWFSPAG
jgi:hypothetical protein